MLQWMCGARGMRSFGPSWSFLLVSLAACGGASHAHTTPRANLVGSPPSEVVDTASWPDARRVAQRTLVLCSVAARGFLDAETPADAEELQHDLVEFVRRHHLDVEMEPEELAILEAPIGTLDRQQMIDATWRLEGMAVLAWSLGVVELPPHDQPVEGLSLCMSLGMLSHATPLLLQLPQRRPAEEIARMQTRLLGIHWRMVDYRVQPMHVDFRAVASSNGSGTWDLSNVPMVDDDLAIRGVRLDRADPSARTQTESIARERHKAINWVTGRAPLYSRVPTDG
jgi:hypothetical protein